MADSRLPPEVFEDTQAEINPYEITDLIWNLIEPYFAKKYNVEIKEAYPDKEVVRPTIVAMVQKRTPGRENSKIHGKGYNFAKFLKTTPDGYVHEVHIQQQEITLEYTVYAISTAEVKRIAWDLERAVLEVVGILQKDIEGFQLFFEQQTPDTSMLWRKQDELIKRTIRFKVLLPVKFVRVVPELRYIDIVENWGVLAVTEELVRSSSEKTYYLSLDEGTNLLNIKFVYIKDADYPYEWIMLEKGTDFYVKRGSNNVLYIEWNDEYGRVPAVGDTFRVEYELSQRITHSSVRPT